MSDIARIFLQVSGSVSLVTALAHTNMGLSELSPSIAALPPTHSAHTALTGWYQGSFLYLLQGLNYLRLAGVPKFTTIDKLTLGSSLAFHVFTIYSLPQIPPKAINIILLASSIASLLV